MLVYFKRPGEYFKESDKNKRIVLKKSFTRK